MTELAWAARYEDERVITGRIAEDLPGAAVPRHGMKRFDLLQGSDVDGWALIFYVELADHERLVFKRRMQGALLNGGVGSVGAVAIIVGVYDTRTDSVAVNHFSGDGTICLRCATADVRPEPHEVG